MEWLGYVVVGVIAFLVLRRIFPSPKQFGAANNALLTEHLFQLVELVPENPFAKELKNAVIGAWRASGFPHITEREVQERFNNSTRFEQLNILAMGLSELGQNPLLPNESWSPVKNPFLPVDKAHVEAVAKRLRADHGINIQVGSRQFLMKNWGISDA